MGSAARSLFAALVLTSGLTLPASGQSTLIGVVRADSAGTPLAGVQVVLEGTAQSTTADPSGRYSLADLPPGRHVVVFRLLGYRPIRVQIDLLRGDTTSYDAILVRETVQALDSIRVTGQPFRGVGIGREAFEERRRLGFGRFIDEEELRRNDHRTVAGLMRSIQGVNIIRFRESRGGGGGAIEERAATGRGITSMSRGSPGDTRELYCWMSVMLDGSWLYQHGSAAKVPDLSRDIRVSDLEMVEVYRSAAEVPGLFSGPAAACGVVLLWTRRGG